ncbi:F24O1.1 [Arabidopsis thaliana]|uniref:F24O1.1 n=1 Tax=Arabidopsis thaliana TaxID=3702 RepID=O48793_ARATH|nr:F24O1.1 [Arabidopsis thaliana]
MSLQQRRMGCKYTFSINETSGLRMQRGPLSALETLVFPLNADPGWQSSSAHMVLNASYEYLALSFQPIPQIVASPTWCDRVVISLNPGDHTINLVG